MSATAWGELAEWYDAKQGDTGDLWHRTLIDPTFLRVVGEVRGLRVLDLGCGNGYLSRRFARAGAVVTGVDDSAPIIERARAHDTRDLLGIDYRVADAAHLALLKNATFDLVTSNMALMDIEAPVTGRPSRMRSPGESRGGPSRQRDTTGPSPGTHAPCATRAS